MSVNVSVNNGIARVQLDNPPYNLLSNQVKKELKETFSEIGEMEEVRVVLFGSVGKHFCCGADLKEFPDRIKNKQAGDVWIQGHERLDTIINVPQPTICYVTGNALGGGAELASAFDIRIFSEDVKIGYPEVKRGVFPGTGGLERLIDLVGEAQAMSLLLTGDTFNASEAFRLGLATKVVPTDAKGEAENMAELLSEYPGSLKIIDWEMIFIMKA
jgi:enoyl-CoA hydratase/carnithine racemase